jgi:nucleoside-diphosphate-sugar epimerase
MKKLLQKKHCLEVMSFNDSNVLVTGGARARAELVNLILLILGIQHKAKVFYTNESWKGDFQKLIADITKIKGHGFQPKIELETALTRFIDWFNTSYLQGQRTA